MIAPFNWTPEIEDEIFGRMIAGDSIATICAPDRDSFIPGERTFYKRLANDPEFAQRYARAREAQAHRESDEIRQIADAATPENVQVARLQVDARKWRASKLAPKVYGDKLAVGGADDLPPIQTEDTSARAIIASKLARLAAGSGAPGDPGEPDESAG